MLSTAMREKWEGVNIPIAVSSQSTNQIQLSEIPQSTNYSASSAPPQAMDLQEWWPDSRPDKFY